MVLPPFGWVIICVQYAMLNSLRRARQVFRSEFTHSVCGLVFAYLYLFDSSHRCRIIIIRIQILTSWPQRIVEYELTFLLVLSIIFYISCMLLQMDCLFRANLGLISQSCYYFLHLFLFFVFCFGFATVLMRLLYFPVQRCWIRPIIAVRAAAKVRRGFLVSLISDSVFAWIITPGPG